MPLSQREKIYLYLHISGLAVQAFQYQLMENRPEESIDEAAVASSADSTQPPALPDVETLEAFLQNGYNEIDSVTHELDEKFSSIATDQLETLIAQLPKNLAPLTERLTGDAFGLWLSFTLIQEIDSPFYQLHHLMSGNSLLSEDPSESIREAIAYDDPELLSSDPEATLAITLEDIQLAIQIGSCKVLPHLLCARTFSDAELLNLFELAATYNTALSVLLQVFKPTKVLLGQLAKTTPHIVQLQEIINYEANL